MGFQSQRTRSNINEQDDSWKASAFLNLWINRPDGTRSKLGDTGLAFKLSKRSHKAFIERMQQPGAVEDLMKVLSITFEVVDDNVPVAAPF